MKRWLTMPAIALLATLVACKTNDADKGMTASNTPSANTTAGASTATTDTTVATTTQTSTAWIPPAGAPTNNTAPATATYAPPAAQPTLESARRISLDETQKKLASGEAVIIDVRSAENYTMSHIKGAKNIPLDQLKTRLAELPKNKFIITYCT
jgi:hypothetical protein